MYENNLENLKKQCGVKSFRHIININSHILPFKTDSRSQTKFNNGFESIMGDFARISSDKDWDEDFSIDNLVSQILANKYLQSNDENKEYLKLIIKEYLISDDSNMNILHPYLFLYLDKNKSLRYDIEEEIALFTRDIFFKDIDLKNFFNYEHEIDNIIVRLILENVPDLPYKKTEPEFYSKLDFVVDVFKEDFEFIKDKTSFLVNNLSNIIAYYYFFYCSQIALKLYQPFAKVDLSAPTKVYSLLDWESSSKNRKSVDEGYNLIKTANDNLFLNMNLLEHLNTLGGTQGLFPNEIYDLISQNEEEKEEFLVNFSKWINYYEEQNGLEYLDLTGLSFEELIDIFKKDLFAGIVRQQRQSFSFNLQNLAKKFFVKQRGQYGFMLNIDKDLIYLITALCIKKDKIKLNDLFKEYERRGLFFDRYSKEEIVTLLNKWNLIDKKSDSGDAQYVKQIL